jgi:predicted alpha/beta superfamily hydrolase
VLFTALGLAAAAGAAAAPVIVGETSTFDSKILGEERTLVVSLPPGYEASENRYPVLYLLDAETRFHHTAGTAASLARSGLIPQMIVVGLNNTDRTRDLTPPWTRPDPDEQWNAVLPQAGGADNFLRFLREELIPHVNATWRTAPYRILVGHSFGGLFALHAFANAPGTFQATLAISPSVQWDEGLVVQQIGELFADRPGLDGRLFVTLGDEGGEMLANFQKLETLLRYRAPAGLAWEMRLLAEENHGSVPIPSVHYGLKAFFPTWAPPPFDVADGLAAVDRHYAGLTTRYGYPIETPEALINNLGYQALGAEEIDKALALFRANVERHPGSANVYDSLGEALEAAGRIDEAREHYRRAIQMGEKRGDPNLGAYRDHLERVAPSRKGDR